MHLIEDSLNQLPLRNDRPALPLIPQLYDLKHLI